MKATAVKNLRQYRGQFGGTVRLGASPRHGYVDVEVRVSETDPRVKEHLLALRKALAEVAMEMIQDARP